jgi:hypothetical protein
MAVVLTAESQKTFFKQTFGQDWTDKHIAPLIAMGAEIRTEFNQIKARYKDINEALLLPVNTNAIMKGTGNTTFVEAAKADIIQFISTFTTKVIGLQLEQGIADTTQALPDTKVGIATLASQIQGAIAGGSNVPKNLAVGGAAGGVTYEVWGAGGSGGGGNPFAQGAFGTTGGAGGVNAVGDLTTLPKTLTVPAVEADEKEWVKSHTGPIKLRDAEHVGQKVRGTDPNSIYTVMALNSRVKLAFRLNGHALSFRAEFNGAHHQERQTLIDLGMKAKSSEYYSMHIDTKDVSPARVVGAFLFDCGIYFDEQIKSFKELKIK